MRATIFEAVWPSGTRVRWRLLRWSEHRRAAVLLSSEPMAAYLAAYRSALVSGPAPEEAPAGIVVWIGRSLIEGDAFSGQFETVARTIEAARASVRSSYLEIASAVVRNLFHMSREDVDSLDSAEFFRLVAAAELLTGVPLQPSSPEAEKKPSPGRPGTTARRMG